MRRSLFWCLVSVLLAVCGCRDPRLVRSIREGESAETQKLISEGADVNTRDASGLTALCVAIDANDKETFRELLAKGASPNLCDNVGTCAVNLAAEQEDIFWLEEVLKHGGNPNQPNTGNSFFPNDTPIYYAIAKHQRENVLALMAAGADVKHVDGNHRTPLFDCVSAGMYDVAMKMIEAGADPAPPKPAFALIPGNGQFTESYVKTITPESRQDYLKLKAMLIEKGYLKPAE